MQSSKTNLFLHFIFGNPLSIISNEYMEGVTKIAPWKQRARKFHANLTIAINNSSPYPPSGKCVSRSPGLASSYRAPSRSWQWHFALSSASRLLG